MISTLSSEPQSLVDDSMTNANDSQMNDLATENEELQSSGLTS